MGPDGKPSPPGLIPTLDESLDNKTWLVGSADDVAEGIAQYRDEFGGIENLVLFPGMPGDPYSQVEDQLERIAADVLPQLKEKGVNLDVYYISSVELFDRLDEEERNAIFPASAAASAMMFSGFTSWWRTPAACIAAKARARGWKILIASARLNGSRCSRDWSVSPSYHGITNQSRSSNQP